VLDRAHLHDLKGIMRLPAASAQHFASPVCVWKCIDLAGGVPVETASQGSVAMTITVMISATANLL
jgi:hypothetical protein